MYLLGNEKYFCKMPAIKCIQNYSLCLQCATNFSNLIRILARITLSKINIRSNKINDICVSFLNRKSRFGGIKVVGGKARYCQNREEITKLDIYSFSIWLRVIFLATARSLESLNRQWRRQPCWALKLRLDVHLRATRQHVDVSSGFGGPAKSVRAFLDDHERHATAQRLVLESVAKADHQSSRDVDRERQHGEQTNNYYQTFSYSQPTEQRQGSDRGQVLHHSGQILEEEAHGSSLGRLWAACSRRVFSPRRQSVRAR